MMSDNFVIMLPAKMTFFISQEGLPSSIFRKRGDEIDHFEWRCRSSGMLTSIWVPAPGQL